MSRLDEIGERAVSELSAGAALIASFLLVAALAVPFLLI